MKTAPIIEAPDRQGRWRQVVFTLLTAVAWLAWFSLWTPLWEVMLWLTGGRVPPGFNRVNLEHAQWLTLIPVGCLSTLAGWAAYNYHRFSGVNRRRNQRPPVTTVEATQTLGTSEEMGRVLHVHRRLTVHFDSQGTPTLAEGQGSNLPLPSQAPMPPHMTLIVDPVELAMLLQHTPASLQGS